jgi:hypothetical protein
MLDVGGVEGVESVEGVGGVVEIGRETMLFGEGAHVFSRF